MQIPRELTEKLSKYFINADPFLWGVLVTKNKKGRLKELKQMGLLATYAEGGNPIYSKINRDLLIELGITGILEKIVIPRIMTIFSQEHIRYFRDCWDLGQVPEMNYLVTNRLYRTRIITAKDARNYWHPVPPLVSYRDPAFIFVQIDTQHNFVERWTVFAGLWFEEIEPFLDEATIAEISRGLLNLAQAKVVDENDESPGSTNFMKTKKLKNYRSSVRSSQPRVSD